MIPKLHPQTHDFSFMNVLKKVDCDELTGLYIGII